MLHSLILNITSSFKWIERPIAPLSRYTRHNFQTLMDFVHSFFRKGANFFFDASFVH